MKRTRQIHVRLNDLEYDAIETSAKKQKLSVAEYARIMLLRLVKYEEQNNDESICTEH